MASNLHTSIAAAQAQAAALAALANGGFIDLYATAQPSTPETAAGGTALVTFALPATFAASVTGGVITAAAITAATIANSGTALWYRVTESDHATPLWDGSVGVAGCDMNLTSVALSAGATLSLSSLTYTVPGV